MLILAFESSAKPVSVAVCSDGELLGQYFQNNGLTHSRTLLSMADSLMKNLDLAIEDIGMIAVSRGPGSFTGVRIGVSAAKGFAFGLDIPVCGVSTLEAIAYQTSVQVPAPSQKNGTMPCNSTGRTDHLLCPVMDARRGQVYNALFKLHEGRPVRLCDDRAISFENLSSSLMDYAASCILLGDGAAICYERLNAAGNYCSIAPDLIRWQTAYGVSLAAAGKDPVPAEALEPCYLRPPQAERERGAPHS